MDIIGQILAILKEWLSWAFCWILDALLGIVFEIVKSIVLLMPNIAVPTWLEFSFGSSPALQFVAWLFPVGILFWASGIWLAYELAMAVVLPIYRMIMDLF